ncbi:MAG: hypothetical protein HFJ28_00830 [Clostridia bacterium]|jgi:hypothetical protein|nr:hypothetical protein [Clostridia bacterium]
MKNEVFYSEEAKRDKEGKLISAKEPTCFESTSYFETIEISAESIHEAESQMLRTLMSKIEKAGEHERYCVEGLESFSKKKKNRTTYTIRALLKCQPVKIS